MNDTLISRLANCRMMVAARLPAVDVAAIDDAIAALAQPAVETPGETYKRGYEEALNDCIRNGVDWARSMFANNAEHIKPAAQKQKT